MVHIAHVLQKLHSFQHLNFFDNLHDLCKKRITRLYRKKKTIIFCNLHNVPHYALHTTHDLRLHLDSSPLCGLRRCFGDPETAGFM